MGFETGIKWEVIFEVAVVGSLICTIQSGYPKAPFAFDWSVTTSAGRPRSLGEGRASTRDDARARVAEVVAMAPPA